MFTTPVSSHQLDVFGVRFVQSSIIHNQHATFSIDQAFCLLPQRLVVWRLSCEQTGEGVMRRCFGFFGLTTSDFCTTKDFLRSDQKLNVSAHSCVYDALKKEWERFRVLINTSIHFGFADFNLLDHLKISSHCLVNRFYHFNVLDQNTLLSSDQKLNI